MPNIYKPSTHEHLGPPSPLAFHSLRFLLQGLVVPLFLDTVKFEGEEHVQGQNGAYVLAARHRSNLDIPAIGTALWRADHQAGRWMAKKEIKKVPGLGRWLEESGTYFLEGERDNRRLSPENIQYIKEAIDAGSALPVFPGATRLEGPGIHEDEVKGAVILPLVFEYGLPFVPVGHEGTEKGDRGLTEVVFGEPIQRERVDFTPDPNWDPKRRLAKLYRAVGEPAVDDFIEELREGMIVAQNRAHARREARLEELTRKWA